VISAHQVYGDKWIQMIKHFPEGDMTYIWIAAVKRNIGYLPSGLLEQALDMHDD
jgi:hypothetical protein